MSYMYIFEEQEVGGGRGGEGSEREGGRKEVHTEALDQSFEEQEVGGEERGEGGEREGGNEFRI